MSNLIKCLHDSNRLRIVVFQELAKSCVTKKKKSTHCLNDFCVPVCYSLRLWAVCWLPPPPVLPQQQLEVGKGCQGWCPSLQGSLCPQSPPSRQHLDLAKRQQIQNLHSRTLAHTKSATANVKVRRVSLYDWCWYFMFTQLLSSRVPIVSM